MDDTTKDLRALSASDLFGFASDGQIEHRDGPSITPSLFFTDEEVASVNWEVVFNEW